jgi:transposase InsO family protein
MNIDFQRRLLQVFAPLMTMKKALTNWSHWALARRHPQAGLVHHADRGSECTSNGYQALLTKEGITVSMSCTGNCYDNAAMESFLQHSRRSVFIDNSFRIGCKHDKPFLNT